VKDGELCSLADSPEEFAQRVLELLGSPDKAEEMAQRARAEVVARRDMRGMTERMVEGYRADADRMRVEHARSRHEVNHR
jgi:hypothetical protein